MYVLCSSAPRVGGVWCKNVDISGEEGKMDLLIRVQRVGSFVCSDWQWDARCLSRSVELMCDGILGDGSIRYWIVRSYWPEDGRDWSVVLRFGARVGRSIPI